MRKLVAILATLISLSAHAEAPELSLFKQQMVEYGRKHCEFLKAPTGDYNPYLAAYYYDAAWVFLQIGDFNSDPYWRDCAQRAIHVYRDLYVVPNLGNIPANWNFSHGLTEDSLRFGNEPSKSAVRQLATDGAYARDTTPVLETVDSTMSREVAFPMMAMLNAEKLGFALRPRYFTLVEQAFGHMNQWFVSKSAPYVRPFMVALTAHALIMNHERKNDTRTIPTLRKAADELWNNFWLPESGAFKYTNVDTSKFDPSAFAYKTGGTEPAPDLNLLIAPIYAYLFFQTGEVTFRDRADQIFAGGVSQAYLVNPKQFNQNYRWSFDYLKWREGKPSPCEAIPTPNTVACTNYFLKQIRDSLKH